MRLIDADAYAKEICTYKETGCGSCKFQICCPNDQPTAYDIGKVVEQLIEASYCVDIPASANIHNPFEERVYRGITLEEAIEIVKGGVK